MRIKSIKEISLDTSIDVYDIEVPETSNFVLSSGIVVHNSKDISDGIAGAVYNASLHDGEFGFNIIEDIGNTLDINNEESTKDDRQNILDRMVNASGRQVTLKEALHDYLSKSKTSNNIPDSSNNIRDRFNEVLKKQRAGAKQSERDISDIISEQNDLNDGILMI